MPRPVRVATAMFVVVLMAYAAWAAESVRVTGDRVNLRSGPSTTSRVVAKVAKGTVLEVLAREGAWIRVAAPGSGATAYVSASLCEPVAAAASPQPTAPAASASSAAPASSASSSGKGPFQLGVHANWASDSVDFGFGGRVAADVRAVPHLGGLLILDYFLGGGTHAEAGGASVDAGGHSIQIGLHATYSLDVQGARVYAGAGLSHFRASFSVTTSAPGVPDVTVSGSGSSTSLGVLGGVKFRKRFFGEARYHFGDASHLVISAGILFDSPW